MPCPTLKFALSRATVYSGDWHFTLERPKVCSFHLFNFFNVKFSPLTDLLKHKTVHTYKVPLMFDTCVHFVMFKLG